MNSILNKNIEELKNKVKNSSYLELISLYNREVGNSGSGIARMAFLSAIHKEFIARGFNYSSIGSKYGLSFNRKIKLEEINGIKTIKKISILDKIVFDGNNIIKSIQNTEKLWTEENIFSAKLISGENKDCKNYITLLFGKGLHLDENSIINDKRLNHPIGWTIRGIGRLLGDEKLIYSIGIDGMNLKLINANPLDINIDIISEGLFQALKELDKLKINDLSIILFNFKGKVTENYFKTIIGALEDFFSIKRNIKKVYLS